MTLRRTIWICLVVIGLMAVAIPLDIPASRAAHDSGLAAFLHMPSHRLLRAAWRSPGVMFLGPLAAMVIALLAAHRRGLIGVRLWRNTLLILAGCIFAGSNAILKWIIGRHRPYTGFGVWELHPFRGGWHGQWLAEANLSMPSGDASLAFALAGTLCIVAPRWKGFWIAMGISVMIERVAENAHYPTDTVAGAAVGLLSALVARAGINRWVRGTPSDQRQRQTDFQLQAPPLGTNQAGTNQP